MERIIQLVGDSQKSSGYETEMEHPIYKETPEASHQSPGVLRNYIWKPLISLSLIDGETNLTEVK